MGLTGVHSDSSCRSGVPSGPRPHLIRWTPLQEHKVGRLSCPEGYHHPLRSGGRIDHDDIIYSGLLTWCKRWFFFFRWTHVGPRHCFVGRLFPSPPKRSIRFSRFEPVEISLSVFLYVDDVCSRSHACRFGHSISASWTICEESSTTTTSNDVGTSNHLRSVI